MFLSLLFSLLLLLLVTATVADEFDSSFCKISGCLRNKK